MSKDVSWNTIRRSNGTRNGDEKIKTEETYARRGETIEIWVSTWGDNWDMGIHIVGRMETTLQRFISIKRVSHGENSIEYDK